MPQRPKSVLDELDEILAGDQRTAAPTRSILDDIDSVLAEPDAPAAPATSIASAATTPLTGMRPSPRTPLAMAPDALATDRGAGTPPSINDLIAAKKPAQKIGRAREAVEIAKAAGITEDLDPSMMPETWAKDQATLNADTMRPATSHAVDPLAPSRAARQSFRQAPVRAHADPAPGIDEILDGPRGAPMQPMASHVSAPVAGIEANDRSALDIGENAGRALGAGAVRFNVGFWGALQSVGDTLGLASVSEFARSAGDQAKGIADSVRGPQYGAGQAEKDVYGGLESIGLNIPSTVAGVMTGNPAVMLGMLGGVTGGDAYAEARKQGVDVPSALAYAASQASIEVLTEKIPASKLLGDLASKSGFLKTIMDQLITEIPGEQVATVMQDLNDWAVLNPEKPFAEYLVERPSAAASTLISTVVATLGQSAGAAAVDRFTRGHDTFGLDEVDPEVAEVKATVEGSGLPVTPASPEAQPVAPLAGADSQVQEPEAQAVAPLPTISQQIAQQTVEEAAAVRGTPDDVPDNPVAQQLEAERTAPPDEEPGILAQLDDVLAAPALNLPMSTTVEDDEDAALAAEIHAELTRAAGLPVSAPVSESAPPDTRALDPEAPASSVVAQIDELLLAEDKPPLKKGEYRSIGKNDRGVELFEDHRGVRSYVSDGVRQSEAVSLAPGRSGTRMAIDRTNKPDYQTADEARAKIKPFDDDVLHVTTPESAESIVASGFDTTRRGGLGGDDYGPGVYLADARSDTGSFWADQLRTKNESGEVQTTALGGRAKLNKPLVLEMLNPSGRGTQHPRTMLSQADPTLVRDFDAMVAQGHTPRRAIGTLARDAGYDGLVIEHRAGQEIVAFDAKAVTFSTRDGKPLATAKKPVTPQLPPPAGLKVVLPSFATAQYAGARPRDPGDSAHGDNLPVTSTLKQDQGSGITVRETDRGSVEIKFATKPDADTLARVKKAGYRWAKGNKVWYKKGANLEAAQRLAYGDTVVKEDGTLAKAAIDQREDGSQVVTNLPVTPTAKDTIEYDVALPGGRRESLSLPVTPRTKAPAKPSLDTLVQAMGDRVHDVLSAHPDGWELSDDGVKVLSVGVSDNSRSYGGRGATTQVKFADVVAWLSSADAENASKDSDWAGLVAEARAALGIQPLSLPVTPAKTDPFASDEARLKAMGREAFAAGERRLSPRALSGDNTKTWYRGWDEANLEAPVNGHPEISTPSIERGKRRAELAAKRAHLKGEISAAVDEIKATLKKESTKLSGGLPVPPLDLVTKTVKLARLYAKAGIVELEDGWLAFEEDFGTGFEGLRGAFEMAWKRVQPTLPVEPAAPRGDTGLSDTPDGAWLRANVERYRERFGRVLNGDNASELFPEYVANRSAMEREVRPAAGKIVTAVFKELLTEPVAPGVDPVAVFNSGGNGAGKSTGASSKGVHLVLDTTLSQFDPTVEKIDKALAAGLSVHIAHTARDVVEAWKSVLERASDPKSEHPGRIVRMTGHWYSHRQSRATLLRLAEHYADNPRVAISVRENSPGGVERRSLDWLREQAYPEGDVILAQLQGALDAALIGGQLTDALYDGATGVPGSARAYREGDRRAAEQGRAGEAGLNDGDTLESDGDQADLDGAESGTGDSAGNRGTTRGPSRGGSRVRQPRTGRRDQSGDESGTSGRTSEGRDRPVSHDRLDDDERPDVDGMPMVRGGGNRGGRSARNQIPRVPAPMGTATPASAKASTATPHLRPEQLIKRLREVFDVPVRTGGVRGLWGSFSAKARVVRSRISKDLPVLAHEFGHVLEREVLTLDLKDPKWAPELTRLGQPTSTASHTAADTRREGVAEFFRLWLLEPVAAKRHAPEFFKAFEPALASTPIGTQLLAIQKDAVAYADSDPVARVALKVDFDGKRSSAPSPVTNPKEWIGAMATTYVDDLARLKHAVEAMAGGHPLPADMNGYVLGRIARGSAGRAQSFLEDGVRDADGTFIGGGIADAITPVADDLETFAVYLVAKRATELHARDKETGLSDAEAQGAVKDIESRPDAARFIEAARRIYAFNKAMHEYARRSGVFTDDQVKAMEALNQFYVPFQRVLDATSDDASGQGSSRKFADRIVPVFRLKGSGRDIVNPLESLIANTFAMVDMVEKNRAAQALAAQANASDNAARWLQKVPPPQKVSSINVQAVLEAYFGANSIEMGDIQATVGLTGDELVTLFQPAWKGDKGKQMLTVIEHGQRVFYQVQDAQLYTALTQIGIPIGTAPKIARMFVSMLRAGATLTPGFVLRNPARDTVVAGIQSRHAFIPVYDTARGLVKVVLNDLGIRKDEDVRLFYASGAAQAALVGADRDRARQAIKKLADPKTFLRSVIKNPLELMRALSEFTETATRVGEFSNALNMGGKAGGLWTRATSSRAITAESLAVAALAARDVTTDFSRGGTFTREMNNYSAFFNARVQGYARMGETLARVGKGDLNPLVTPAAMAMLSILLWALNGDDDEYKELPEWERIGYWHFNLKYIGGPNKFLRMAKPFEYALIPNMAEAALEWAHGTHPDATRLLRAQVKDNARQLAMGVIPSFILPIVEVEANYSTFRQRNIVSPWNTDLPLEMQANDYTTETAKLLARTVIPLAPAKIDHLLFGYTAGVGRGVVEYGVDPGLAAVGIVPPAKERPSKTTQQLPVLGVFLRDTAITPDAPSLVAFHQAYREMQGANRGLKIATTEGNQALAKRLGSSYSGAPWMGRQPAMKVAKNAIDDIADVVDGIYAAPPNRMTPAQKREALDANVRQMTAWARYGLGRGPMPGAAR